MNYKYTSKDEMDTLEIAQNIESEKFPNMVICLNGELGSGKTVFVKGFAQALGIEENVTTIIPYGCVSTRRKQRQNWY